MVLREWQYRSLGEPTGRDGRGRAIDRVGPALRVAPIDAGSIRLIWESGPAAAVSLAASDPAWWRWMTRVLVGAYRLGEWVESRPSSGSRHDVDLLASRPVPDGVGPFPSVSDGEMRWSDSVLRLLPATSRRVSIEWSIAPLRERGPARSSRLDAELTPQPPGWRAATPPQPTRATSDRLEERRIAPALSIVASVRADGTDPRAVAEAKDLAGLVERASRRDGGCGFSFRPVGRVWARSAATAYCSPDEVATLFPGPSSIFSGRFSSTEALGPPIPIGIDEFGDGVSLAVDPSEGRHLLILGETGMGKSTVIVRGARRVSTHAGVVLFDPIGDTAQRFLATLPKSALDRVTVFDPSRSGIVIDVMASLRPAGAGDQVRAERSLEELVFALRRVRESRFGESPFWGPRVEESVRSALRAAALLPGATLEDAARLLSEPHRHPHGIPADARSSVEALLQRALEHPEAVDGARRVLEEVSRNASLSRTLAARRPTGSVTSWVGPRSITIVSGAAGTIGENASRYLLAILLGLICSELLGRTRPEKTFLVLDEAQRYVHESASEVLRLGRRANVHVWTATQALSSLPDGVREAVRTNSADLLMFRGSPVDAAEVAKWLPSLTPGLVMALPRGRALLLSGKGSRLESVTVPLDGSRSRWTLPDATPGSTIPARSPASPVQPAPPVPTSPLGKGSFSQHSDGGALRDLLREVLRASETSSEGPTSQVEIERLSEGLGTSANVVRSVGGLLGREGVLIRRSDGPAGRLWEIDRERLRDLLKKTPDAEDPSVPARGASTGSPPVLTRTELEF